MKNTVLEIGGENKMGFRTGAYAKVWKTEDKGNYSVVELSTSKKNKQTGKYETDFNGKFVRFIGQAHTDIKKYGDGIKIKLGDVEVTNSYNKETKISYTNFLVFSFEAEENTQTAPVENDGYMSIPDGIDEQLPFL